MMKKTALYFISFGMGIAVMFVGTLVTLHEVSYDVVISDIMEKNAFLPMIEQTQNAELKVEYRASLCMQAKNVSLIINSILKINTVSEQDKKLLAKVSKMCRGVANKLPTYLR